MNKLEEIKKKHQNQSVGSEFGVGELDVDWLIEQVDKKIMNPFEEVKELMKKIQETSETIKTTDYEYFDKEDLEKLIMCSNEIKEIAKQTIRLMVKGEVKNERNS